MKRAHDKWGPDMIMRHGKFDDLWAIFEAKGGKSRLGTSKLKQPSVPQGMSHIQPNTKYPQMGAKWLEFWIRHTIDANRGTPVGDAFKKAFKPSMPIVTAVVSVNMLRRNEEIKIATQVFVSPHGISFNSWPTGF